MDETPPIGSLRSWHLLSEIGTTLITVRCERCNRRGQYRADRLIAVVGDVGGPEALSRIAAHGGCERAIHPPSVNDISFNDRSCQIKLVPPPRPPPAPMLQRALQEGWQLFLTCQRHHQGLKATKPCPGRSKIDLPTLVATLGHDCPIDRVAKRMVAPCCGSKAFTLEWVTTR